MKKIVKGILFIGMVVAIVVVVMKVFGLGMYKVSYTVNTMDSKLVLIGHGGGSLKLKDGAKKSVTNAKNAFYHNYNEGLRYFEGDLVYTSDHKIVLRHRWEAYLYDFLGQKKPVGKVENAPLSYQELMSNSLFGEYESMDIQGLINFLEKKTDAYFITDIKDDSLKILTEFTDIVEDKSILNRIIPQIYSLSEYEETRNIYDFPKIYLTLYNSPDSNEEIVQFIKKHKLGGIVCGSDLFEKRKDLINEAHKVGIPFYVHTINSLAELEKYEGYHIDGVYTDLLRERNGEISDSEQIN